MVEIVPKFFRASEAPPIRRLLGRLDWSLIGVSLFLALVGMAFVYSATAQAGQGGAFVGRQAAALVVGIAGMAFLALLPYQVFHTYAKPVVVIGILLLVAVLVFGVRLRGSKSWFYLGILYFQPIELSRLALAVGLAAYADARFREMGDWRTLTVPLGLTGLFIGVVLLQPDLSSSLSLGPMMIAIAFAAGAPVSSLLLLMGTASLAMGIPLMTTYVRVVTEVSGGGVVGNFLHRAFLERGAFFELWAGVAAAVAAGWWFLRQWRIPMPVSALLLTLGMIAAGVGGSFVVERGLKDYQRKRLIAFLNPAVDPLGAGYNIRQSEITLGSGRFLGKGYLSGSQSQLGFLPEKHTDFIFSLVGEEWGFAGTILVLAGYFWVVFRAFDIASTARDRFGRFLAVGVGTHLAFTGMVNIGMVMGLMPVTGLPLPFLSYGGSGLVGSFLAVGLLLSIHLRRYIL